MNPLATAVAELFSAKAIEKFFEIGVTPMITNDDYEGEVRDTASKLNILTFTEDQGLQNYTGANLTLGNVKESKAQLATDQSKAYYFKINSIDRFKTFVKDPESTLMIEKGGQLQEAVDAFVLGKYTDIGAGNRVGTDYTTGTVAVTVTTGAVTGTGTTFTSAMVGRGFKATGHTKWYRIASYASATSIVIMDDMLDITQQYTGGTIGAGATYTIEAVTPVTLSSANVYDQVLAVREKLDASKIPTEGRFLVGNSKFFRILDQANVVTRATPEDTDNIKNGYRGVMATMQLYQNEQVQGDAVNGFWAVAGHKSAIVFAMAFTETGIEDLQGNFGKAYKGLNVYGAKVPDERRKALAGLFFK